MFSFSRARALGAPCVLGAAFMLLAPVPAAAQSAPAAAASPAPSPSPAALSEIGRVTTSDRQDEPAAATARSTYVVTKAQMLLRGDNDVAAALSSVPGVLIERDGGPGALAAVTIRGERNDGVLVLLDGRPIAGGEIGDIDLASMPTAGVERIEVVEGSGATLYGSGATGGVINIITTRANAAPATPQASLEAGSYGEQRLAFETPTFAFAREYAVNDYPYAVPGTPGSVTRANADLSSTNARFSDAGTFGNLQVSGSAGFTSRILGVPGGLSFLTSYARQQDDAQDARVTLALDRPNAVTTLDLSGSRQTLVYLDPSVAEGGPFVDFNTDARVQASLRDNVVSGDNRLVYGVDLAHGVARNDGSSAFGPAISATPFAQTGGYVQDSLGVFGTSRIYAGLRAERDGAAGAALTPSLGAIAGLGGGLALRLNAGTGFRVPTAEDLDFPGFSNPALEPERTQSLDASLDAAHVLGGVSLGWFVQTAANLITVNPNVNYGLPFGPSNEPVINEEQSAVDGFVLDAKSPSFAGIAARVSVTDLYRALAYLAGATATRRVFTTAVDVGYTGPASSRLAAAGAIAHTVGALDDLGDGDFTSIDTYVRLRVATRALLSLRVFDLGNKRYTYDAGYPVPGRTYAVELSTR
jgi:outer membrane cobalamin receptor